MIASESVSQNALRHGSRPIGVVEHRTDWMRRSCCCAAVA